MIGTVFRSSDVPQGERLDRWRELIDRTRATDVTDLTARTGGTTGRTADFQAELHLMELGPVTAWRTTFPTTRLRRTAKSLRRADPELYHLSLVLDGELTLVHDTATTVTAGPRQLIVDDNSRPCEVHANGAAAGGRAGLITGVGVDFPKALLPGPPGQVEKLLRRGLSVQDGTGALVADFLAGLDRQAEHLRTSDAPRLGTVLLDLVSALFAHTLDTEAALPQETRHEVLARQVRTFIRRNLHDPELTPRVVASAHHISLSHLHRVFTQQSQGETVAAWIRGQRLERARHDLADPSLRTLPIQTVAARWGIPRASDFTRAFRTAYGISPSEHRHQTQTGRA
ncbi:AraC family transcriptional regulator [Streptomyces sp. NPDC001595]|uniref:AraC family transcriptional regulator n=1 Tax=Streptomyces sp. NPDC001532 TaxID=3154520 RepID=UPI003325E761